MLLLGVAHGIHDMFTGAPVGAAILPALPMALQILALSYGYTLAERRGWSGRKMLGLAILVSGVFGALAVTLHFWSTGRLLRHLAAVTMPIGLLILGFWGVMFYYPGQLSSARMRAVVAESAHRNAELARLRASLHPHFLLNTLNAIAGLLVVEPQQARQLVVALGDLLRDSLDEDSEMRPLDQEVKWLRRYAEIFEVRHRGAIRFEWDLASETLSLPVPRLLLQPLIENSIEHGVLRRPGGGTISVRSRLAGDAVQITVSDNGRGMESGNSPGLGLRLVTERAKLAYPDARMVTDTSQAGTSITLELPRTVKAR
jgi:signal transduction histidine kinase